jgi:glycosyltransferase involved in cell wall biosynthesis
MAKIILVANTDWYLFNFRLSLAKFLRNNGFEVLLVSPSGKYVPEFEKQGFRFIPWPIGRKTVMPNQELSSIRELIYIYKSEKPDLVHHHTVKPILYGSYAARKAGIMGLINSVTGRGYVFSANEYKAKLLRPIVKSMYKFAFRQSNCMVVFENGEDRNYFLNENLIAKDRTELILGVGVDTQRFKPMPEPKGDPTVMYVGRLLKDKGVNIFVEAARILKKKVPVRFVFVGDPDPGNPSSISVEKVQAWVREGIVEWWGWQSEMNPIYAESNIIVLPTMYGEGVPTVLLEAAACGRAIIASDMPGCRDIVIEGKNGFLVTPGDPITLADALYKLIADPVLRTDMGTVGRELAVDKFRIELVNESTFSVYKRVLKNMS